MHIIICYLNNFMIYVLCNTPTQIPSLNHVSYLYISCIYKDLQTGITFPAFSKTMQFKTNPRCLFNNPILTWSHFSLTPMCHVATTSRTIGGLVLR